MAPRAASAKTHRPPLPAHAHLTCSPPVRPAGPSQSSVEDKFPPSSRPPVSGVHQRAASSRFQWRWPGFDYFFASRRAWTPLCAAAAAPAVQSLGRWAGAAHTRVFSGLRQRQRPCGDVARCARCSVCMSTSVAPALSERLRLVFASGATPPPHPPNWGVAVGNLLASSTILRCGFASNSCLFGRLS